MNSGTTLHLDRLSLETPSERTCFCIKCWESVPSTSQVWFGGKCWHSDCFKCVNCNKKLDPSSEDFSQDDQKQIFCKLCVDICNGCSTPICEFNAVSNSQANHPCCSNCRAFINSNAFGKFKGQHYCLPCLRKQDEENQKAVMESASGFIPLRNIAQTAENTSLTGQNQGFQNPHFIASDSPSSVLSGRVQNTNSPTNSLRPQLKVQTNGYETPGDINSAKSYKDIQKDFLLKPKNSFVKTSPSPLANGPSFRSANASPFDSCDSFHSGSSIPIEPVSSRQSSVVNNNSVQQPVAYHAFVQSPTENGTLPQLPKNESVVNPPPLRRSSTMNYKSVSTTTSPSKYGYVSGRIALSPIHLRGALRDVTNKSNLKVPRNRNSLSNLDEYYVNGLESDETPTKARFPRYPTVFNKLDDKRLSSEPNGLKKRLTNSSNYEASPRAKSLNLSQVSLHQACEPEYNRSSLVRASDVFTSNVFDATEESANELAIRISELQAEVGTLLLEATSLASIIEQQTPVSPEAFKQELVADLNYRLDYLRKSFQPELSTLLLRRDALSTTVSKLQNAYSTVMEETAYLNVKNTELVSLNNQLERELAYLREQQHKKRTSSSFGIFNNDKKSNRTISTPSPRESFSRLQMVASSLGFRPKDNKDKESGGYNKRNSKIDLKKSFSKRFHWKRDSPHMSSTPSISEEHLASEEQEDFVPAVGHCKLCGKYSNELRAHYQDCVSSTIDRQYQSQKSESPVWALNPDDFDQNRLTLLRVPTLIVSCINFIESYGMDFEGLYRKSGATSQMKKIVALLRNEDTVLDPSEDISAVTSVFKQYLRNLPNPIITYDQYFPFITAANCASFQDKLDGFIMVIKSLPPAHAEILQLIIRHLARVAAYSHANRMTSKNLAVVFSPTLIRDPDNSRDVIDMTVKNYSLAFLIDHVHEVFA